MNKGKTPIIVWTTKPTPTTYISHRQHFYINSGTLFWCITVRFSLILKGWDSKFEVNIWKFKSWYKWNKYIAL